MWTPDLQDLLMFNFYNFQSFEKDSKVFIYVWLKQLLCIITEKRFQWK